jgi:hypothetical protein
VVWSEGNASFAIAAAFLLHGLPKRGFVFLAAAVLMAQVGNLSVVRADALHEQQDQLIESKPQKEREARRHEDMPRRAIRPGNPPL